MLIFLLTVLRRVCAVLNARFAVDVQSKILIIFVRIVEANW